MDEWMTAMDMKTGFTNWQAVECDAYGRLTGLMARGGPAAGAAARRILVPVDGSATALAALHVALRMAGEATPTANVEVHLLNVQIVLGTLERDDSLLRQGLADTWAARAALDEAGLPYMLRLTAAIPSDAILAHAREHAVSDIVMGADGAGSLIGVLFGSVAADVLAKAEVPVTLARSGCRIGEFPAEWVDWLVACDGSPAALRALRHALAQLTSRPAGPCLHLLTVCPHEGFLPIAPDAATMERQRQRAVERCREALALLDAAAAEHGIEHRFHVAFGDPAEKILETAGSISCGHLVMGAPAAGPLASPITNGVLRRSPMPVSFVK